MAQQAHLESDVDRYSLAMGEELELSVTLEVAGAARIGEPELQGPSNDFDVLESRLSASTTSIVNGRVSVQRQWSYILQPRRTGQLTVPGVRVTVNDRVLTTAPRKVQVTSGATGTVKRPQGEAGGFAAGSAAPFEGTPELVVRCHTDKKEAFVNEQVIVRVEYYFAYFLLRYFGARELTGAAEKWPPGAEGLLAERLSNAQTQEVSVNGVPYVRVTCLWAVFASSPGQYTIALSTEPLNLPPTYQPRKYTSQPLLLKVKPLPPPPPDFSGAVGQFTTQLTADKTQVRAGQVLSARVIVDGLGALQDLAPPPIPALAGASVSRPAVKSRTMEPRAVGESYVMASRAEFEYVVVPRQAGSLTIPAVSIVYFDPAAGRYRRATSESLQVSVTPGEVTPVATPGEQESTIRHIHAHRPRLVAPGLLLLGPAPAVVLALCLGAVAAATFARVRKDRRCADPARVRASRAATVARRALRRAAAAPEPQFCTLLGQAVAQYLADRFDLPVALVWGQAWGELQQRGLSPHAVEEAAWLLDLCNRARFGPGSGGGGPRREALQRAEALIRAIEREGGSR